MRGIDSGLNFDTQIKTPDPEGLLMQPKLPSVRSPASTGNQPDGNAGSPAGKLQAYMLGIKDYPSMPMLAKLAIELKQRDLGTRIARDYVHEYMDKLPDQQFCTKENLELFDLIPGLTAEMSDRVFDLYLHHSVETDVTMGVVGYARAHAAQIILREEITPLIAMAKDRDADLDWERIEGGLAIKYGTDYARYVALNAKVTWYRQNKKWPVKLARYLVEQIQRDGLPPSGITLWLTTNTIENPILRYDNDNGDLRKAAGWDEAILNDMAAHGEEDAQPGAIDGYAVILYRIGRIGDAIAWQQRSIELLRKAANAGGRDLTTDKGYQERLAMLEKMKRGDKFDDSWFYSNGFLTF
jgi:hypothetical protein